MKSKKLLIDIAIILGFMLIISGNVFVQQFSNLDEIWIYNFGRCIINGLLPYKDFSIIITPLFAYISASFLKIFGDEMIVLRFAEVLQTALILFMSYKVLERLNVNKGVSILFTLGLYYLYYQVFCFDYNWAVLLVALIIIYIELKEEEQFRVNFKRNLFIGVLAGIAILLKQTSGLVLSVMIISYKIFEFKNFKNFKDCFEICTIRLLGVLLPILLFAIYLTVNNIWTEFIDYTILGISTFSNNIPYTKLFSTDAPLAYAIPVFLAIIIITSIITLISKKLSKEEWTKKLRILVFFDIATAVVVYPISDRMHFAVSTVCTLLTVVYLVHVWFKYGLKIKNQKVKSIFGTIFYVLSIIAIIIYSAFSVNSIIKYVNNTKENKYLRHFNYIETSESLYKVINKIDKFIEAKEQNVIILDSMAAAINIPIDKYYKDYDMFNLGNFGKNGEEGIIENLKYRKNTLFLVKKDEYANNWQHPDKIVNYVKDNFTKVGEIEVFDIYTK